MNRLQEESHVNMHRYLVIQINYSAQSKEEQWQKKTHLSSSSELSAGVCRWSSSGLATILLTALASYFLLVLFASVEPMGNGPDEGKAQ